MKVSGYHYSNCLATNFLQNIFCVFGQSCGTHSYQTERPVPNFGMNACTVTPLIWINPSSDFYCFTSRFKMGTGLQQLRNPISYPLYSIVCSVRWVEWATGHSLAHSTSCLFTQQRATQPARCLSELSAFINLLYIIIITGRCSRLTLPLLMSQHRFIYTHRPYWLRAYFCHSGFSCWAKRGSARPGVLYQCTSDRWNQ